ncbi:hypothetical protein [Antarcticimicrobium luteum]|uniref:Glycosyltransferase n=1 Tax=Antarcticimicrobium luteum TaxID=2547397 RepID=A0A4R5VE23_9RHOB|nr:hypothetical protein [Antarcticimicrobium luteum]TDK50409.1 hypothetical protein E1832_06240 [Antarcticimicrobium luteum]
MKKTLVFSLGQGGYDKAFSHAVESQREYAATHGYDYVCVAEPGGPTLGRENIWLKTLLLYGALLKNDYVLYLDTDVRVQKSCPPVREAVSDDAPIGVVAGHSGRVNAGVILAQRNRYALDFFSRWAASLGKPIASHHDVGWGENGHLIRLIEQFGVQLLDTRWNNTFDPALADYMRHYTGPLRNEYLFEGEEKEAWDQILNALTVSKESGPVDIITSYAELKDVYAYSAPAEQFASFDECWEQIRQLVFPSRAQSASAGDWDKYNVYVAEEVSDTSPNAYVTTLRDGLERVLGARNVKTGVDAFWNHNFSTGDVLHIEWIESLFRWKVPSEETLAQFEARMHEIAATSPIIYTAHNFDLMPTYGDSRVRMLQSLADNASLVCHLSEANIEPYNRHHAGITGLKDVPTAVVPHGDYQPYFRLESEPFEDAALQSEKIKILVFGHIRTEQELNFCLDVGKALGEDRFQLIFAGAIHPDILHWKELHRFRDEWDGGARRIHLKVPNEQVVSLVSQCDGMLVPRFDRLNSGVQFLAYSMLKPVFVPAQNSMEEVQNVAVGAGIFALGDVRGAAEMIRQNFDSDISTQIAQSFRIHSFNYKRQDPYVVGLAHRAAYQKAVESQKLRKAELVTQ